MQIVHSFSSFSVADVAAAQKFYSQTLGLTATIDEKMGILKVTLPGGGETMLYPKGDQHKPADFTVLNLIVSDIDSSVDELIGKGVTFEQYDNEYIKTDAKGIARTADDPESPAIAWFKDSDGNIMSLIEDK